MFSIIDIGCKCQNFDIIVFLFVDTKVLVITSPPWGVLEEENDVPLGTSDIGRWASLMKVHTPAHTNVAIHLPVFLYATYVKAFKDNGWAVMRNPITIVQTGGTRHKTFDSLEFVNNTDMFFIFYQAGNKPFRSYDVSHSRSFRLLCVFTGSF